MPTIELDESGKGFLAATAVFDQGDFRLADELFDQPLGGDIVDDPPVVPDQRQPEATQRCRLVIPFPRSAHGDDPFS